jgi:hypothetical protein
MPRKKLGAKTSDDEGDDDLERGTAKKEEKAEDEPRSVRKENLRIPHPLALWLPELFARMFFCCQMR